MLMIVSPMWHLILTIVKLRYKTWNRSYLLFRSSEKVLGRPSFILSGIHGIECRDNRGWFFVNALPPWIFLPMGGEISWMDCFCCGCKSKGLDWHFEPLWRAENDATETQAPQNAQEPRTFCQSPDQTTTQQISDFRTSSHQQIRWGLSVIKCD